MPDTVRSPDEIERDIERERAELAGTIDALQDRFSADHILREVGRSLSDNGSDIGRAITQSVKQNPVALALTGVGIAWLVSGRSWSEPGDPAERSPREIAHYGASDFEAATPRRSTPPAPRSVPASTGYAGASAHPTERRRGVIVDQSWLYADDDDEMYDYGDASGPSLGERVGDVAARAGDKASAVADNVKSGAQDLGDRISDTAEAGRDAVSDAAASAASRARRIRARLAEGTEHLGEAARERVVAARWQAVKARRKAARHARRGAESVSAFIDDNPLLAGGLALAAGAALAGGLPRTRQEDDLIGHHSDRAYDRAERIFREEKQKALHVAQRARDEAQEIAAEKRAEIDGSAPGDTSAVEAVADEIRDGVDRVVGAAKDEAAKQDLGGSAK